MPASFSTAARTVYRELVDGFVAEQTASLVPSRDPFNILHDCLNPAGHETISSCGDVVCRHCAKVFWQ